MPTFYLHPEANDDLDEMTERETERWAIIVVLGLILLTALMLSALFYLY